MLYMLIIVELLAVQPAPNIDIGDYSQILLNTFLVKNLGIDAHDSKIKSVIDLCESYKSETTKAARLETRNRLDELSRIRQKYSMSLTSLRVIDLQHSVAIGLLVSDGYFAAGKTTVSSEIGLENGSNAVVQLRTELMNTGKTLESRLDGYIRTSRKTITGNTLSSEIEKLLADLEKDYRNRIKVIISDEQFTRLERLVQESSKYKTSEKFTSLRRGAYSIANKTLKTLDVVIEKPKLRKQSSLLGLLAFESVKKHIHLAEDEAAEVEKLLVQHRVEKNEVYDLYQSQVARTSKEVSHAISTYSELLETLALKYDSRMKTRVSAQSYKRLLQISTQLEGVDAAFSPIVLKPHLSGIYDDMKTTAEQRTAFDAAKSSYLTDSTKALRNNTGAKSERDRISMIMRIRFNTSVHDKIFTENQRKTWSKYAGPLLSEEDLLAIFFDIIAAR